MPFTFIAVDTPEGGDAVVCYEANLNGFLLDSATPDADGLIWTVSDIDGWFEGPPTEVATSAGSNEIETVTAARRRKRNMTVKGTAQLPTDTSIDALYFRAQRRLKAATQPLLVPELMIVSEPDGFTAQALVRLAAGNPYRFRRRGNLSIAALEFEMDVFAPDWRRYSDEHTETVTILAGDDTQSETVVNAGDAPSPPVITIDGPAVQPQIQNLSLPGSPFVRWAGTLSGSDTLVIDMGQKTAVLNGTIDARPSLINSMWWQLQPGNNTVKNERQSTSGVSGASVVYRDAYT